MQIYGAYSLAAHLPTCLAHCGVDSVERGSGELTWRESPGGGGRLRPKADTIESGTGDRMGTIRADFHTHCDHRRDPLMLLPVVRKLLLEMLQEVDLVRVDTPCLTAPQGDVLHMWVAALQTGIRRTVFWRDTGV